MKLEDETGRGPIAGLFLASALVLVVATAVLTFHLVDSAVEERVRQEIERTARLLGSSNFPLGDESLRRVAGLVGADVVAADSKGHVVAASLGPEGARAFEAARRTGALPAARAEVVVVPATLGERRYTVGIAALPGRPGESGAVYVLYGADLLAEQGRRAWLPVTGVAAVATLLAALLGMAGERIVLRARTRALLRLLAAVAHEVRNPLGAIRALARSLSRKGGPQAKPLELIATEAERLGLLVEGLRTVGQPVRTVRKPVDPDGTVRGVLALVEHQLAHRRVVLSASLGADGARVVADGTQVQQVVLNLVQNAADAMPRGGRVVVESRLADDAWRLDVQDEGPGVPEAVRARLFEPFFTTKAKGLGVGLYLSRRLAQAHGGDLALVDGPGGARFRFTLPLGDDERPSDSGPVDDEDARGSSSGPVGPQRVAGEDTDGPDGPARADARPDAGPDEPMTAGARPVDRRSG